MDARYLLWSMRLLVASHLVVIALNLFAMLLLPFVVEWYIALPLLTFLANWAYDNTNRCPLTVWENHLRRRIGLPEIDNFLYYYLNCVTGIDFYKKLPTRSN